MHYRIKTLIPYRLSLNVKHSSYSTASKVQQWKPRYKFIYWIGWSTVTIGVTSSLIVSYYLPMDQNTSYTNQLNLTVQGTYRSMLTFVTVSWIMAQYKYLFWQHGDLGIDSNQYKLLRSQVHLKSAKALLWLCQTHGGIYNKAAQHVGSLVKMVPKEFSDTLSVLQDKAPFHPYEEICRVFRNELNGEPTDFFQHFNKDPIAAASLAQVHQAVTFDGMECAVKVQYENVVRNVGIDLVVMDVLTQLVSIVFPEFKLGWIVKEFDDNLKQEFDFRIEANNAKSTQKRFAHRIAQGDFYVPQVRDDLTSKRIMTMEFIHGTRITNMQELHERKYNLHTLQRTLIDVFSEMIFVHGFVHCDPHPGNMLVRQNPAMPNITQLVLLDHGLYRDLDESFRQTYCDLWVGILTQNDNQLQSVGKRLGHGGEKYWQLFPFFFAGLLRPRPVSTDPNTSVSTSLKPTERTSTPQEPMILGDQITDAHRPLIRASIKQAMTLETALEFIESLPRDMLLVMRTVNLVSGVHRALGGTNRPKFRRHAYYAVMGKHWPIQAPNWFLRWIHAPALAATRYSFMDIWSWGFDWALVSWRVYLMLSAVVRLRDFRVWIEARWRSFLPHAQTSI